MIIKSKALAVLLVTLLFGGILFSTWMNWWQTESNKTPARYSSGDFAGEFNPSDIRGSYTLGDIENSFQIPVDLLVKAFGVPTNLEASTLRISELESFYSGYEFEVGTASVRLFIAWYQGLPFEISEETYLPQSAIDILVQKGTLNQEQIDYLHQHSVIVNLEAIPEDVVLTPEVVHEPENPDDTTIKGKTTFREVLDWGLSTEQIEIALGGKQFNPLENIKDYCLANGLEFGTVKLAIQAELDKLP